MWRDDDIYIKSFIFTAFFLLRRIFETVQRELFIIFSHIVILCKTITTKNFEWSIKCPESHEWLGLKIINLNIRVFIIICFENISWLENSEFLWKFISFEEKREGINTTNIKIL